MSQIIRPDSAVAVWFGLDKPHFARDAQDAPLTVAIGIAWNGHNEKTINDVFAVRTSPSSQSTCIGRDCRIRHRRDVFIATPTPNETVEDVVSRLWNRQ